MRVGCNGRGRWRGRGAEIRRLNVFVDGHLSAELPAHNSSRVRIGLADRKYDALDILTERPIKDGATHCPMLVGKDQWTNNGVEVVWWYCGVVVGGRGILVWWKCCLEV